MKSHWSNYYSLKGQQNGNASDLSLVSSSTGLAIANREEILDFLERSEESAKHSCNAVF